MRRLPEGRFFDTAGTPVDLIGPPEHLVGRVKLRNRSGGRAVIREAVLVGEFWKPARSDDRTGHPVSLLEILEPLEASIVDLEVAVDPQTPPGDYEGMLQLPNGEEQRAVLHVLDSISLDVDPAEIAVENVPGARYESRVRMTNAGNVPLHIGNIGLVGLDEEMLDCKVLRSTFSEMMSADADSRDDLEEWATTALEQAAKIVQKSGTLRVDLEGAPLTLDAGEQILFAMKIRVPETIDTRSRYRGVTLLHDTQLNFSILPSGAIKKSGRSE